MSTSKTHTGTQVLQALGDTLSLKPKPLKYMCGIIGLVGGTVSMYLTALLMNKLSGSDNFELFNEFVIMGVLFDLFKNLLPVIAYRLWIANQKLLTGLTSVFFTGLVLLSIFASITALDTGVKNVIKTEKPVNPNIHLIEALESNLKDLELLRDRQVASNQTTKLESTTKDLNDLKVRIANLKSEGSFNQNIATPSSPLESYGHYFIYLASVLIEVLCLFATVSALVITDVGSVISSASKANSNNKDDTSTSANINKEEQSDSEQVSEKLANSENHKDIQLPAITLTVDNIQDRNDLDVGSNIFQLKETESYMDNIDEIEFNDDTDEMKQHSGVNFSKLSIAEEHFNQFETMNKLYKVKLRDTDEAKTIFDVVNSIFNEEVKITFRGIDEMFKLSRQGKKELFDLLEKLDYVERNSANGTLTLKYSLAA
ncbi:TPA: hypothetical protein I7730_01750 [Vibrio vulnificus]|uniref:Uncharacterized protein n=1 Tax=Vibrio vulnificus TaxID=672 RepID=A0A8H9K627_VIBVL|nr:hypothetical protein [Vibrio vulnificus]HAS8538508.1 hypothetical protein [Vibrio vulnificus]